MTEFTEAEMGGRLERIRSQMASAGLGAFLSADPPTIRYATGFRGEPGTLLLTGDEVVLYTSFRTLSWAERQTSGVELSTSEDPLEDVVGRLDESCVVGDGSRSRVRGHAGSEGEAGSSIRDGVAGD